MVWDLNVQLESIITTRCFANMSKVTCASMARNQRIMRKRGKWYKRRPVRMRLFIPMWATSLSIIVRCLPIDSQVAWWFVDYNAKDQLNYKKSQ